MLLYLPSLPLLGGQWKLPRPARNMPSERKMPADQQVRRGIVDKKLRDTLRYDGGLARVLVTVQLRLPGCTHSRSYRQCTRKGSIVGPPLVWRARATAAWRAPDGSECQYFVPRAKKYTRKYLDRVNIASTWAMGETAPIDDSEFDFDPRQQPCQQPTQRQQLISALCPLLTGR